MVHVDDHDDMKSILFKRNLLNALLALMANALYMNSQAKVITLYFPFGTNVCIINCQLSSVYLWPEKVINIQLSRA